MRHRPEYFEVLLVQMYATTCMLSKGLGNLRTVRHEHDVGWYVCNANLKCLLSCQSIGGKELEGKLVVFVLWAAM